MRHRKIGTILVGPLACLILVSASWRGWAWEAGVPSVQKRTAQGVAHYILAVRSDLLGDGEAAVRHYSEAARRDPAAFAPRLRLGMEHARAGRYDRAVVELEKASALAPEDVQSRFFLALVYSAQKDFDKANREYEEVLSRLVVQDPRNVELFTYLAQLYLAQGNLLKAVENFERVIALDGRDTESLFFVAAYYLDAGRREDAIALFRKCIDADPFHDGCLNSLSYTYAQHGENLDEALALVTRALEVRPDQAAYIDTLGWVYYQQGQYIEALKEIGRADVLLKDPEIKDHLGDIYLKLGDVDMARRYWRLSLEEDPDQVAVRAKLNDLDIHHALQAETGP